MTTAQMPTLQTRAEFQPATFDAEARTVDLCWTTGSKGLRSTWWGERYYEELVVTDQAVKLDRLNAGAALLNSHDGYDLAGQIGVVERAWIEGGRGMATVRFSEREDVAPILKDVQDGIIRNVSVGYQVNVYEKIEAADGTVPTMRAVDWTPMELSLVPVPFDPGAQVRAIDGQQLYPVEIRNTTAPSGAKKERKVPNANRGGKNKPAETETETRADAAMCPDCGGDMPANGDPCPDCGTGSRSAGSNTINAAIANERNRANEINRIGEKAGVDVRAWLADGSSPDVVRRSVIEGMAAMDAQTRTVSVQVTRDETDTRRAAMENAIVLRGNARARLSSDPVEHNKLVESARNFRGMSLIEMAREAVEAAGGKTRGMGPNELAGAALNLTRGGEMSTSDFPDILANVVNKSLRQAYTQAPQTWRPLAREVTARDFKTMYRIALSEAPRLVEVKEGAEITRGSFSESQESYAVSTYAKIVALTRKTIINDDLNAFSRIPELYGRAAADLESDTVWALITGTPTGGVGATMADGQAVFYSGHSNIGIADVISIANLSTARAAMRSQKALAGLQYLNLQPKYLIVPPELETVAQQYTWLTPQLAADSSANVNPFAGSLTPLVEPRLSANSAKFWYLGADPSQIDMLEVAYLDGQSGLYIETRQGFEVDGVEIKARLDFGAGIIDYRGFYLSNDT